jgi:effector-binding domain-containing protein
MKRIIRLTERDLTRIVKRTIMEMEEDGEKFKLSPEHLIKDLNHNVDKFIKSKDLDEEESFRRLDYFIQRDLKPILNKAEEKGLWTDEEIEYIIRYLKIAYNYDYSPDFEPYKKEEDYDDDDFYHGGEGSGGRW